MRGRDRDPVRERRRLRITGLVVLRCPGNHFFMVHTIGVNYGLIKKVVSLDIQDYIIVSTDSKLTSAGLEAALYFYSIHQAGNQCTVSRGACTHTPAAQHHRCGCGQWVWSKLERSVLARTY